MEQILAASSEYVKLRGKVLNPKLTGYKILNRYLHEQEIIRWVIIGRLGGVLRKLLHKKPFFTQIKTYFLHS